MFLFKRTRTGVDTGPPCLQSPPQILQYVDRSRLLPFSEYISNSVERPTFIKNHSTSVKLNGPPSATRIRAYVAFMWLMFRLVVQQQQQRNHKTVQYGSPRRVKPSLQLRDRRRWRTDLIGVDVIAVSAVGRQTYSTTKRLPPPGSRAGRAAPPAN